MKTIFFTVYALLALSISATAAKDPEAEVADRMSKVTKLQEKEKYDEAVTELQDLLAKYPRYGKGWDKLLDVRIIQYNQARQLDKLLGGNMTVTSKSKDGSEAAGANDSLANSLAGLLSDLKPSKIALDKMLLDCRLACINSGSAWNCSIRLRNYYVDAPTDTNINREARQFFSDGEEEFMSRNYNKAAEDYRKAIAADPNIYRARLYLGDVYYFTKRYSEAIEAFREAVAAHPEQQEPLKYLSDAYYGAGVYDKAYKTAEDAVIMYPDLSMLAKLADAAESDKHAFAIHRIARGVLPVSPFAALESVNTDEMPYRRAAKGGPWEYYSEARSKIVGHYDEHGLLSGIGDITRQRYLEVYCWEYMLSKSQDPDLNFARKMQEKGFLDCYVMVSCFHQDFYDQYRQFAEGNKQRIRDYFALLAKEQEDSK
ncbi:MAG: tetratricopeptide repeat protein [Bacteroidetes bacterium]|nr:tetratricopeptide repeat protein [Bacteroidota bacterium]